MEYLELLFPVFTAIFAIFAVAFFFLQQQWCQSGHGVTQQQKEKTVILPPFWQLGWRRPWFAFAESKFRKKAMVIHRLHCTLQHIALENSFVDADLDPYDL
jgi:hypothetical protein